MPTVDQKFDAITSHIAALKQEQVNGATLSAQDQKKITKWEKLTADARTMLAEGNIEWESEPAPKGLKGMLIDAFDEVAMSTATGYISRSMRERYRQDVKAAAISSFEAPEAPAAKPKGARPSI